MKQQLYKKQVSKIYSFFAGKRIQHQYQKASIFLLVCLMPMSSSILTYHSTLEDGIGGISGLKDPYGVVVSPDGNYVYTASSGSDAVVVFSRNAITGELTFVEAQIDDSQTGGTINGLNGGRRLTISPDGKHLYVPATNDNALVVFSRNSSTGALTYVETHVDGSGGITALRGAYAVAVSPDGNYVYVASLYDNAVVVFSRNSSTGTLTLIEEHFDGVGGVDGLKTARDIKISPDGSHVYVAGTLDDAVAVFSRNTTTGELTYVEVVKDGTSGVDGIDNIDGLFISHDNAYVYTASIKDDAVTVFSRNTTTGKLSFVQVLKDDSQGGTINNLNGARAVTGTSDGAYIFVATSTDNALVVFSRNSSTGELTLEEEHVNGIGGVDGLEGARYVAISPDDSSIYTVSTGDDAITTFNLFNISLPITLLDFEAKRNNEKQVLLTWTTASEKDNLGFEIQISDNGKDFQKVDFVEGQGNSSQITNYQYTIDQSSSGYYRLKQIDFDGRFEYSAIKFVDGIETNLAVNIYPNPSQGEIQIDIPNYEGEFQLSIFNSQGKEILNAEGREEVLNEKLNHIFPHLDNGLYIFKIQVLDKVWTERIILRR